MLTVKLNNGLLVMAKLYHGTPSALTYVNWTQARKAADKIGGTVHGTHPFYVAPPDLPMNPNRIVLVFDRHGQPEEADIP